LPQGLSDVPPVVLDSFTDQAVY